MPLPITPMCRWPPPAFYGRTRTVNGRLLFPCCKPECRGCYKAVFRDLPASTIPGNVILWGQLIAFHSITQSNTPYALLKLSITVSMKSVPEARFNSSGCLWLGAKTTKRTFISGRNWMLRRDLSRPLRNYLHVIWNLRVPSSMMI